MEADRNDRSERLNAVIVEIMQGGECGRVDEAALLAAHPDLADELRSFLADYSFLQSAVAREDPVAAKQAVEKSTFQDVLEPTLNSLLTKDTDKTLMASSPLQAADTKEDGRTEARADGELQSGKFQFTQDDLPRHFGDYDLLELIAFGGMGVVYKARHRKLDRIVAVKMILAGQFARQEDVDRFFREARAAGAIDHSAIVPVYDVGTVDGQHYYSMGFVDGGSLTERIAEGPLDARNAAGIVRTIAKAVAFAHQAGVIHRDIKPGNLLIDADGEPRITDFGLASRQNEDQGLTLTGQILGTPAWMPPEQATGRIEDVGPLSDVYSIGAVLYATLTGRPPFMASQPIETLRQVTEREPVAPRALNVDVPWDLETICLKCLEKNPDRRYLSAAALADDLDRFLSNKPIAARPVGRMEKAVKWMSRHRVLSVLMGTTAVALIAGTAASTYFAIESNARATAEQQAREDLALKEAEANRLASDKTQLAADRQETIELMEDREYVARLREVQAALESGDYDATRRLLEFYVPQDGETDRRCFAWQYFDSRIRNMSPSVHALPRTDLSSEVGRLKLSPNGVHFATSSRTSVLFADRSSPSKNHILHANANTSDIAYSRTGEYLFVAGGNGLNRGKDRNRSLKLRGVKMYSVENLNREEWVIPSNDIHPPDTPEGVKQLPRAEFGACVACSPTAPIVACGMRNGRIALWNYETRERLAVLIAPDAEKESENRIDYHRLAFSPDGRWLASARYAHAIDLWDVDERKHARVVREYVARIPYRRKSFITTHWLIDCGDLAFSPDGMTLAVAANGLDFSLIDLKSDKVTECSGHGDAVTSLAFAPDGDTIVSGSLDHTIRMWDTGTGTEVAEIGSHRLPVQGVAVVSATDAGSTRQTRQVLSIGSDDKLRVWSLPDVDKPSVLNHGNHIYSVRFLPDGNRLLVGGWPHRNPDWTNSSGIFDTTTGEHQLLQRDHVGRAMSVDVSRDGSVMVSGNVEDQCVDVWDAEGNHVRSLPTKAAITSVSLHPDGRSVAAADLKRNENAAVYDVDTGEQIRAIPGRSVFSPDGRLLATIGGHGLTFRDARTFEPLMMDVPQNVQQLRFSPDGRLMAYHSGGTAVRVFDLATEEVIFHGDRHYSGVSDFTFAPDGVTLATVSRDRRVLLWDLATGEVKAEFTGHRADVSTVDFNTDGTILATGSVDGTVRLWRNEGQPFAPLPVFSPNQSFYTETRIVADLAAVEYANSDIIDLSQRNQVKDRGFKQLDQPTMEFTTSGLRMELVEDSHFDEVFVPLDCKGDFDFTTTIDQLDLPSPGSVKSFVRLTVTFHGAESDEMCSVGLKRRTSDSSIEASILHKFDVGNETDRKTAFIPVIASTDAQLPIEGMQLRIVRRGQRVYFFLEADGGQFKYIDSVRLKNEQPSSRSVRLGIWGNPTSPVVVWKNLNLHWNQLRK